MSELGPEARAFLNTALDGDRPPPTEKARVRAILAAQLGTPHSVETSPAGPGVTDPAVSAPVAAAGGAAGSSALTMLAAVVSLVAVGGVIAHLGERRSTPAVASPEAELWPPPPVADVGAPEPGEPSPPEAAPAPSPAAEPPRSAARARVRSADPRRGPSALAEEAELVADIQRALRDDAPARALDLVDQHALRFPRGALEPERWAAQGLALCALGRPHEARESRARLAALAPSSPLLVRLDAACGFEAESDE